MYIQDMFLARDKERESASWTLQQCNSSGDNDDEILQLTFEIVLMENINKKY